MFYQRKGLLHLQRGRTLLQKKRLVKKKDQLEGSQQLGQENKNPKRENVIRVQMPANKRKKTRQEGQVAILPSLG